MDKYIEFKRRRELGETLTDTFKFVRRNFKPLFQLLVKTVAIPFILLLFAIGFYTYASADFTGFGWIDNEFLNLGTFFISAGLLAISGFLYYSLLFGSVLHFIRSYTENKGVVDQQAVIQRVKRDLGKLFGLGVISVIMLVFGFLLCVFPGIYLYVPLSMVFALAVFRNQGISDSISNSFKLIHGEWWMTFITLFVIGLIIGIIGFVFQIPALIYTMVKTFTAMDQGNFGDPRQLVDGVYIALSVISSAVQYFLYLFTVIATAFIYFDLNEKKNNTGTLERIDALGEDRHA
ncbi:hypothetical protein [Croceiramulus getboli]|nr:hypothetical protein P8624_10915 [Flavobacteriaceae bacterium YJPT1-3]